MRTHPTASLVASTLVLLCAPPLVAHAPSEEAPIATAGAETVRSMTRAAGQLIASLTDDQRARALFDLDDEERYELRLAPMPRWGGLPVAELALDQQALFHVLLSASLSPDGFEKVAGIVALEGFLVQKELAAGRRVAVHGVDRYSFALFGDPAPGATWGWRLQGHHLSVNFLVDGETAYASAPAFLGAEPHHVTEGPRAGWRILRDEEDLGRRVLASLDDERRARAVIAEELPRDMFAGDRREYDLGEPRGLAFAEMTPDQQEALRALVEEYVRNVPADVADRRRAAVERGGWESVHFAWIGPDQPGERMYYRVHGPGFLIEYSAVALSPNHVHTIWREKDGDFGRDLLAEHMREAPH